MLGRTKEDRLRRKQLEKEWAIFLSREWLGFGLQFSHDVLKVADRIE